MYCNKKIPGFAFCFCRYFLLGLIVFGSIFVGSNPHRGLYFSHYVGDKIIILILNMLNDLNLTDMENCCKMF